MAGSAGPGREAPGPETGDGSGLNRTTVRLTVEYDGSAFCGFQYQPTMRTVGGDLAATLSRLFEEPVKLSAAGRTDTGVHASGQVVSFTTARSFPFDRLAIALNSALPADISIREAVVADADFSARFSARQRRYVFAILRRREASALLARYAYHVWRELDIERMREAARHLLGEHDFASFCGVAPESGNTVRTVAHLEIEERGDLLRIDVAADGFLHRMVRTIAGTLVECGIGRREPASLAAVLAARTRTAAGHTAPPQGLYLAGVRYPDGYDSFAEPPLFAPPGGISPRSR